MKFPSTAITLLAYTTCTNAFLPSTHQKQLHTTTTNLQASYLDNLAGAKIPKAPVSNGGSGISNYLNTVPVSNARVGGAGFTSYLDAISQECDAVAPTAQCAEAITEYLGALSSGDAPAHTTDVGAKTIGNYLDNLARSAPRVVGGGITGYLQALPASNGRIGGSGIQSYLSSVGGSSAIGGSSAPAVKSYLDAMSTGVTKVPSAPAVQSFVNDISAGHVAPPTSGAGIASYLSSLPVSNGRAGGAGIQSHLNTIPTTSSSLSGAGFTTYLDTINRECDAVAPTEACADAIGNYMEALTTGDAPAESTNAGAKAIGGYLDNLASVASARMGGAGITSYLDSVSGNSAIGGSANAVKGYLDDLTSGQAVAPSAPAVQNLVNDVSSGF
eukprot:scaffold6493_cov217-Alexandrium_tamarense.AAC.1